MIITNNSVLILPDPNFVKDGEIQLFDAFEPAKHFSVKGTVLAVPNKLNYYGDEIERLKQLPRSLDRTKTIQELNRWSLPWDTNLGIVVGDEVYFHYMNRIAGVEDNLVLGKDELGERGLLFVDYDQLYMGTHEGLSWMLNGYILVEAIEYSDDELMSLGGGFEKYVKSKEKPGFGIVRSLGIGSCGPNKSYLDGSVEGPEVWDGMEVLFRHSNAVPFEYKYHKTVNEGKYAFYKMQRKDILAYR